MPIKLYNRIRPQIGLLIDIIYENYQAKVWEGVVEGAKQLGVDLINFAGCSLRAPYGYRVQRNIVYDLVNEECVDGLILTGSLGSYIGEEEFRQFYERFSPMPMVSVSTHIPHIPSVLVDNVKGMEQCVNHLIKKHHCRNFAFIRGPMGNSEAELRYNVFKDVLSANNIPLLPELILEGDFYKDSGAQGVSTLLDNRKIPFDVIIAANDVMAIDALEELQRRNIKVPEDVLVVGFDDIEGSRYTRPPLATVHQPLFSLGFKAVEILVSTLNGETVRDKTALPAIFLPRKSCGCTLPRNYENDRGAHREYESLALPAVNRAYHLHVTGQELITTFNFNMLKDIAGKRLPFVGIKTCFITLYSKESHEYSDLFFKLTNGVVVKQGLAPGRIKTSHIVSGLIPSGEFRKSSIVMALFFRMEQIGFIIFEMGPVEGMIYENLVVHFVTALKGAFLTEQLEVSALRGEENKKTGEEPESGALKKGYILNKKNEQRFSDCINSMTPGEKCEQLCEDLRIDVYQHPYWLILFNTHFLISTSPTLVSRMKLAIAEDVCGVYGGIVSIINDYILLVFKEEITKKKKTVAERLFQRCREISGEMISLFISKPLSGIEDIRHSFFNGCLAFEQRFLLKNHSLIFETDKVFLKPKKQLKRQFVEADELIQSLYSACKGADVKIISRVCDDIKLKIIKEMWPEDTIKTYYSNLFFSIITHVKADNDVMNTLYQKAREVVRSLDVLDNIDDLAVYIQREICEVAYIAGTPGT